MPTDLATVLLDVDVPGDPAPQGSKRLLGSSNGGRPRAIESSKKVAPWRADVRDSIVLALASVEQRHPHTGPVQVELIFRLRRPAGHYGTGRNAGRLRDSAPMHPTGKPDADKLARAVLDAITSTGMVYVDDSQVIELVVCKYYAAPLPPQVASQPGVHITVRSMA